MPTKAKYPQQLDPRALQVMSIPEFAKMMRFSYATAKRMIKRGEGPKLIQISTKLKGVRLCDALAWQEQRTI